MPATTPLRAYPYQELTDPPDGAALGRNLALAVEADTVALLGATTEWRNVRGHGATGDGTTDDTAAIQAALNAAYTDDAGAPWGRTVYLPPGTYRTSAPLVVPPYVTLVGSYANRGNNIQRSTIRPLASFAGTGVVSLVDAATGGYSTPSGYQRLLSFTIDGRDLVSTTSGIRADGLVHGVMVRDVSIHATTDRGVHTVVSGLNKPYSWHVDNVQVTATGLDGFRLASLTDSTLVGCRTLGCGRHGYFVDNLNNTLFVGCRAEWSGQNGFYLSFGWGTGTGSGGMTLIGCATDRNTRNGVLVDATGNAPLVFDGLLLRRDGRNGGSGGGGYAGFAVAAATCPVLATGVTVYPGVDDTGAGTPSPEVGLTAAGSTWVSISSGYLHAATTALADGGGNTSFQVGPNVGLATGPTGAPVRSVTEPASVAGPFQVNAGPLRAVRAGATDAGVQATVIGDSVNRWNVTAAGELSWGSGSGARDTNLFRSAADVLRTDDSLVVGAHLGVVGQAAGLVTPAGSHALLAWSYDVANISGSKLMVNGTVYLIGVYVSAAASCTRLLWGVGTAGVTPTAGQNEVGIYNSAGTRLAVTNVDADISSTGPKTTTIASQALTPGLYWVGLLFNAATAPSLYRSGDVNATLLNVGLTAATARFATNGTGATVLPASITPGSNANAQFSVWAALGA